MIDLICTALIGTFASCPGQGPYLHNNHGCHDCGYGRYYPQEFMVHEDMIEHRKFVYLNGHPIEFWEELK